MNGIEPDVKVVIDDIKMTKDVFVEILNKIYSSIRY